MRFPQSFLDEITQRLPVSQVVSRYVKLKRQGREFTGLSPFKAEKTPSFTINDQKGFFHCFATGEHGNIFSFLMKTQGLSFFEAVEQLAQEAGVPIPANAVQARHSTDNRRSLYDVMEAAAVFFENNLSQSLGHDAKKYLHNRDVSEQVIKQFRLGYAPRHRFALKSHLEKAGFTQQQMIDTGMLISGEDIATPYDRFRNRIIFPICDLKGRIIAFGGRALDPDQPAKYLNSPETELFHKGHILFNAHNARQASFDTGQIYVVEGYMDVIALMRAGVANAVAPLGTALTSQQLQQLWRFADEPTLCFDGDAAGRKAAYRALEMALSHLTAGKSLNFAFLPDGLDPDDLLKQQGQEALQNVLQKCCPFVDVLWDMQWSQGNWETPERKAALEKSLYAYIDQIQDQTVQLHYRKAIKNKLYHAWRPQPDASYTQKRFGGGKHNKAWPDKARQPFQNNRKSQYGAYTPSSSDSLLNSSLVQKHQSNIPPREALLFLTMINHPWVLDDFSEQFVALDFENRDLSELRNAILYAYSMQNSLDNTVFREHLIKKGYEKIICQLEKTITHKCDFFVQPNASQDIVRVSLEHILTLQRKNIELNQELNAAILAFDEDSSDEIFNRLHHIQLEIQQFEKQEIGTIESFNLEK
ncbi:MAG: DNA primase [Pseudomonadota bacterium]